MATVYLAIQEVFEREVALKVMSKVLAEDPHFGQRFFREAKIVSKLVHPNIVTVHDVGMHDGYCYLSMEYIDGRDLKHVVRTLSLAKKIRAVRDIAKALDYAGSKGYVHRDIKPENIMFHSSDGRAVLMDFGIARAAESDTMVTQVGTAIGTPHYMSPEQAKGKAVDGRSDIYSLGVVFYTLVAGHVPYDAESAVAIGIKHITEPVPLLPKGYEGLQHIIDTMMSKKVEQRYQNAKQLMEDIDQLDIALIEHAATIAKHTVRSADVSSEEATLSHIDGDYIDSFEMEDEVPTVGTYAEFDAHDDTLVKERNPILPWFFAGAFVLCVVSVFIHFKQPEFFRPLIDTVMSQVERIKASTAPVAATTEPVPEGVVKKTIPRSSPAPDKPGVGQTIVADMPEPSEPQLVENISASSTPGQVDPLTAEITALADKINSLSEAYANDSLYFAELVETYNRLLAIAPQGHPVFAGYAKFKQREIDKVMASAQKNGSYVSIDKRVKQLRSLFPNEKEAQFDAILQAAKQRKKVLSLILEAEAYYKQNNLTQPPGRNALDTYEKVLKMDKANEQAALGKRNISLKLYQAATKYQSSRPEQALKTLNKALVIDPTNRQAQQLRKKIEAELSRKQNVESMLKNANKKLSLGSLFSPVGASAFDDYQLVLKLDPSNTVAKVGLDNLMDALSAKMWRLVGDEQFLQAKELMRRPSREFGANPRVVSLSSALDEVIGEEILDVQPRIERVLVKGEPIGKLSDAKLLSSSRGVAADRSIFLGFSYENFQTKTTVIQAVLMDGAKRLQIAQVPVVVEGNQGESTFRIDRPVEGFPSGSYSIEMRLGPDTLNSMVFKVE